jgi:vanillate O-demethylase monooxygenase subunit
MYPFENLAPYPRNRWYVAAFSREISQTPFQRTLLDVPVALYRTDAGRAVAMYGICPHRYYPLANGKVEGDALVCGYHGFAFAETGKCVRIPSQNSGAGFTQPTYPLEERGTLTWIWMGDPEKADPADIPDYADFGLDQDGWAVSGLDYIELKARSQLLVDNVLDLTHLPHIHFQIPGGHSFLESKQSFTKRERSYQLRQIMQLPWTPFFEQLWGSQASYDGFGQVESITDFYGPELVKVSGPCIRPQEKQDTPEENGVGEVYFMHACTPETATTSHYFSFQTRNFRVTNVDFGKWLGETDLFIREQDKAAIDDVEKWAEYGSARQPELAVKTDRMSIEARKMIREMIEAER